MAVPVPTFAAGALAMFAYFYTKSNSFKYYTKFTVFTISALVCASVYIPLMLFRPFDYRNAFLPCWSLLQIGKLFGLTFEVRGKERVVKDSGAVIVINHQSSVDLLVTSTIWPIIPNCACVAKKEIFYMWPFGLGTWLWGTVFIDRLNSEKARSTINKTAATINTKHTKLCMFPEGTRHGGETLLPFKKGAFYVAIESQCPIQPIVVSRYHYIDHEKKIFGYGHNIIEILSPVQTRGLNKDDIGKLIDQVYNVMNEKYKQLSQEILSINNSQGNKE